ncbi:MAG: hypothetical protein VKP62_06330 [Candidatus Sericytochromatia bacterium]|nr:hypothetical protein [Candidatus Sericytochromatia bacterium]
MNIPERIGSGGGAEPRPKLSIVNRGKARLDGDRLALSLGQAVGGASDRHWADRVRAWAQPRWDGLVEGGLALLFQLLFGARSTPFETRRVLDDPGDANDPDYSENRAAEVAHARHAAEEQARLKTLDSASQGAYASLKAALGEAPLAKRALQALLLDGRLTGGPAAGDGGALLAQLDRLRQQPLLPGLERKALLNEVVIEAENPVRVNQHQWRTCGAATAQILLLRENPAEYVRVVAGLAAPEGRVTLLGGQSVRREADWDTTADGGRTAASRLFQATIMELAGPRVGAWDLANYDARRDLHRLGPLPVFVGLPGGGLATALQQLTGKPFQNHSFRAWGRDALWAAVKQALAEGRGPVPTALAWGEGGHFVQIDRIADGTVFYTNPWGCREAMDEAEFQAHALQVQIQRA